MKNRTIFLIIFILLYGYAFSQDMATEAVTSDNTDGSSYNTSVYLRYNMTRPDYANTPYFIGFDIGADMDLGGDIAVLNIAGIGFSGKYIFLNSKDETGEEISTSHYFSTGLSFYLKTRFEKPVNMGLRAGTGSGWMISGDIDEETENNKRLNGIYMDAGFFTEFRVSEMYYLETGVDVRKQHYFRKDADIDPVDMGFIYVKAGIKL